ALDRDDVAAFRVETVEKVASDAAGKRPVVGADEARAGDARGTADEAHEWDAFGDEAAQDVVERGDVRGCQQNGVGTRDQRRLEKRTLLLDVVGDERNI